MNQKKKPGENRTRQFEASIRKLAKCKHEKTLLLHCHASDLFDIGEFATTHGVWLDANLVIGKETERLLTSYAKRTIMSLSDDAYDPDDFYGERRRINEIYRNPDSFERRPQKFAKLTNIAPLVAFWAFNNRKLLCLSSIIVSYAA